MDRGSWRCIGGSDQDRPQEKEMQRAQWLSEEALKVAEKRRDGKVTGEKEIHTHLNAEFQRKSKKDKTTFLSDNAKI